MPGQHRAGQPSQRVELPPVGHVTACDVTQRGEEPLFDDAVEVARASRRMLSELHIFGSQRFELRLCRLKNVLKKNIMSCLKCIALFLAFAQ